jgi:RecJ-like exonuclease
MELPQGLRDRLEKAKERILREESTIRIISHYDADGICAAGILCHALLRINKKFHTTLTRSLKTEFIEFLKKDSYPITILCDMGSSEITALSQLNGDVIILDHHVTTNDSENPLLINPRTFDMDGTEEACASSVSFMFACVLDENNQDLSPLALAGCIGDKQHMNGLKGFNAQMVKEAKENGIIEEKKSLKFGGGNIKKSLEDGLDPYIRDMSGREEKVIEFLKNMNLDLDSESEDLEESQKRLLASAIIVKLLAQKVRPEIAEGVITNRYWLPKWNLFADDLSNYINSCGRMDNMGLGLALCLGDEKALERAKELRKTYKDELREGIMKLEAEGPHELDNIQFFYTENPSLAGAHAGLGMMFLFDSEKPTFALTVQDKETKVSSRGTKYLVSKGLDLAEACRKAAMEVGGKGGGHPVASGATIPKGKEEPFLNLLDEIVGNQLKQPEIS